MNSKEIINFIANAKKKTPCKIYIKGKLKKCDFNNLIYFGNNKFGTLFCELHQWTDFYNKYEDYIKNYKIEIDRRNSAVPLADYSKYNARIEPGVFIRKYVEIGDNCVIMMGAILNIGAIVGKETMIDMNVVIGGRAKVGNNCHIGAGSVIAGVIEPPSASPVIIEDNVLLGANSVILEGVRVCKGSVVAAGAVVVEDVEANTIVAGIPAKVIKRVNIKTKEKTSIVKELRRL